mgnify:FL=1
MLTNRQIVGNNGYANNGATAPLWGIEKGKKMKKTTYDFEQEIGPRGSVIVNGANRGLVRQWVTSCGISGSSNMSAAKLSAIYNDTTNGEIEQCGGTYTIDKTPTPYIEPIIETPVIEQAPQKPMIKNVDPIAPQATLEQDAAQTITNAVTGALAGLNLGGGITESDVINLINIHAVKRSEITINDQGERRKIEGTFHPIFEEVCDIVSCGEFPLLIGPAGSGKSTLGAQVAKALDIDFYVSGAIASEFKLNGFRDAQGQYAPTAFRNAWEKGGLFLFDEMDASLPQALMPFNGALANSHHDFPDNIVEKSDKFACIAAANTFGLGADRQYVGRNQLDAATLDRFTPVTMDYDQTLERTIAGNDSWVERVQSIRKAVFDLKLRFVISPRASIKGAKFLAKGMKQKRVEALTIFAQMDAETIRKVKAHV